MKITTPMVYPVQGWHLSMTEARVWESYGEKSGYTWRWVSSRRSCPAANTSALSLPGSCNIYRCWAYAYAGPMQMHGIWICCTYPVFSFLHRRSEKYQSRNRYCLLVKASGLDARHFSWIKVICFRLIWLLTYKGTSKNGCQAKHSSTIALEGNTDSEPQGDLKLYHHISCW